MLARTHAAYFATSQLTAEPQLMLAETVTAGARRG